MTMCHGVAEGRDTPLLDEGPNEQALESSITFIVTPLTFCQWENLGAFLFKVKILKVFTSDCITNRENLCNLISG